MSASDALDSHMNARRVNISICDGPSYDKNKPVEPIIPPQPVPPEIEQQRALSISKVRSYIPLNKNINYQILITVKFSDHRSPKIIK